MAMPLSIRMSSLPEGCTGSPGTSLMGMTANAILHTKKAASKGGLRSQMMSGKAPLVGASDDLVDDERGLHIVVRATTSVIGGASAHNKRARIAGVERKGTCLSHHP